MPLATMPLCRYANNLIWQVLAKTARAKHNIAGSIAVVSVGSTIDVADTSAVIDADAADDH